MAVDVDTEIMNNDVQNSWPDETMEVRQELLDASPYLSDAVMINAAEQEDVLPNAILTEVLVANPQSAKSNIVMEAVDNRDTLLNQTQFDQVMQGKLIAGAKEKLESRLSAANGKRTFAMKNLIMAWQEDTLINAADSILVLLENEENAYFKYALIETYFNMNDTNSAITAYNSINTDFDLNSKDYENWLNFEGWLDYRLEQKSRGKSVTQPDSLQLVTLYQLYNNSESQLKATFRNLLMASDTLKYFEPYITIDTTIKSGKVKWRPYGALNTKNEIHIYPNPSRDYFIIDFSGLSIDDDIIFADIYSIEGKPVKSFVIYSYTNFKTIDTRNWKPGFYFVVLKSKNSFIGSSKVTILH